MNKKNAKVKKVKNKAVKKPRKKVGRFYKVNLPLVFILSIILLYFIVLVGKPRSIPYVDQKVSAHLKEVFGNKTSLEKTYVNFTRHGTLRVAAVNVDIIYQLENSDKTQEFIIPKVETEFSLLNLFLLRFYPSKIKFFDPKIAINNIQKEESLVNEKQEYVNHIPLINKFLSSIRQKKFPIKTVEIENAIFLVKCKDKTQEIHLKNAKFSNVWKGEELYIKSLTNVNFSKEKADVQFVSSCKLSKRDNLKCDLSLDNFVFDSIVNLSDKLELLSKIDAKANVEAHFELQNRNLVNFYFTANSQNGSFSFLDFFSQKMDFDKFLVSGDYDHKIGVLNLSKIDVDFASKEINKPHLEMSLLISGILSDKLQGLDFYIKLQNTSINEIEKYWPSKLGAKIVRPWVVGHLKNGVVRDSYAKFSLAPNEEGLLRLEQIDAQLIFKDADLNYHKNFPKISKLAGIASFSKEKMKISILDGKVLNSKIFDSTILIDDFFAEKLLLKIEGKSKGYASDSLKHVDYKSSFAGGVEHYLNGDSNNEFKIIIPLRNTSLKKSYIFVKSDVKNLKSEYAGGDVKIVSTKDFLSNNFISNINLDDSSLHVKALDIYKEKGSKGSLSFIVDVSNLQNIAINNILLLKNLSLKRRVPEKIHGNLSFDVNPFKVSGLNITNENFGKNNYNVSYVNKKSLQRLIVNGQSFNLASFMENDFFKDKSSDEIDFKDFKIRIALNKLSLLNKKEMRGFYFSINCDDGFCSDGLLSASYDKDSIGLKMVKDLKQNNKSLILGNINNIGYLAEAFGFSNLVSKGDAKVKLNNQLIDNSQNIFGEIIIDNDIIFYEDDRVKRFAKDDLFSKIKDKIFSDKKTIFNSLKLDLEIRNKVLNVRSLIANNYKIGITAKGFVNLNDDSYQIKGMIVPGFVINNLFGIGKIPILGNVVSDLLTGGEGGGLFGVRYEYTKGANDREPKFKTHKISAFVPTAIKDLFD